MTIQYTKPKLLLVEGPIDKRFFSGLLGEEKIRSAFQIEKYEGEGNIPTFLKAMAKAASFRSTVTSLGITRDADNDGAERKRQSLCGALYRAGLSQSEQEIKSAKPNLYIDVHILGDSTGFGRLEEMILEAVADNWRTFCVDSYWNCLEDRMPADDILPEDKNKTRLAVFLASQKRSALRPVLWEDDDDSLRLDFAAQRGYLNLGHEVYQGLKEFLQSL